MTRGMAVGAALIALLAMAAPASAGPVATNDGAYTALGRVFPDPLANCQRSSGSGPCSPGAQGNVPAVQFIGIEEFLDGLRYMNREHDRGWNRYMEVWPLDGKDGDASGSGLGDDAFPGNDLGRLEYSPKAEYRSAGLPQTDTTRKKSDLMVVRVTDETVPDAGKKRYALSLSIHGIERAGAEGGIRTMEDFVTAVSSNKLGTPILPEGVEAGAPTFDEVLRKSIIYFTFPNPDGWRRGSVQQGGVFFQRYNGNGVDPNRDWPDVGFTFRPYSGLSEPESRAFSSFYGDVRAQTGADFAAGDDLHGMPEADALSYTLMPHGLHEWDKDIRIRESSKTINRATYDAVKWSPIVQPNSAPKGGGAPCSPDVLGEACAKIYGQTWGTVYDTINYTTTGALGDWFDSRVGLNSDGIDNEMAFSHLDKNIVFDPHTEQMHVDGNRALIMARLSEILAPPSGPFDAPGRKGYVANERVSDTQRDFPPVPPGTRAQDPHEDNTPEPGGGGFVFPIEVKRTDEIYNGGMRVDITAGNVGGIGGGGGPSGLLGGGTLKVQCLNCDDHPAPQGFEEGDWITVAEDYNQSPVYAQAGLTAAVNNPDASSTKGDVRWRAFVEAESPPTRMNVTYTSGPASVDGNTEGGNPPFQRGYDVANTDFWRDLDKHVENRNEDFDTIDPRKVIDGSQSLGSFDSIVLSDSSLPGYTGIFDGERELGGPTADFDFAHDPAKNTQPGLHQEPAPRAPGTYETKEFSIGPDDGNQSLKLRIEWADSANDFDFYLYRKDGSRQTLVGSSTSGSNNFEEIVVERPAAGDYIAYIDNWSSSDDNWTGTARFAGLPQPAGGSYTRADKDQYFARLQAWVEDGGNLILTDGALRALSEFSSIPASAISQQRVYVGQTTFAKGEGEDTLDDPLAANVDQPGSRFNTGMRRQMFEPTPLGFAIQEPGGANAAYSRQWQVTKEEWEKAGGRTAGTSADSGDSDAGPVYSQVTLGELKRGKGQIRIAGALLPQPSEEFDHQFGIEPYAVTYTGYIVVRNLFGGRGAQPGSFDTGRNFVISRRAVKLRKGKAGVRVSCRIPRGGCRGVLRLRIRRPVRGSAEAAARKKKRRYRTIGRKRFNIPSGRKRNFVVKVKVTKSGRKAVRRLKRRTRARASATVSFADGANGRYKRSFRFYRPSPGRR
jgi:Zinc carboxypeptidase